MSSELSAAAKAQPFYRRPFVWVLLLALAGGGVWLVMKPGPQEPATAGAARPPGGSGGGQRGGGMDRPQPVIVAPVEKADMPVYLDAIGTVTARSTVTVRPRVDGQLMRLLFREGQTVKAGDLLAEIDPRPFQVQLAQAEGQMARDRALLLNAQQDLERYRTLVEQDSATRQQLDAQEALVRQYEGAVKTDQAAIDSAQLQLTYSRVTAPVGGKLGLRQVDVGNMVHASDANGLVVITQVQPIDVVFSLPQGQLTALLRLPDGGAGLAVHALAPDSKRPVARGKVLTVDNQIDPATGTVKLKAEFANDDARLFPNQFVAVRLQLDLRRDAVVAPSAAVLRGAPGTFVYVANADKTVSMRPVSIGPGESERTIIESGLQPGEQVVVDGTDKLREGAQIEPVSREEAVKAMTGGGTRKGGREGGAGSPRGGAGATARPAQ
ncbi:MAG: MdtA/MuxA family multidrug efflux RND transporter periplasmic adaptor subunit [Betaproteobacteria bacterium]|nr:MdtA/MuxA family multidrug efflux RND transporter periplasmic adaptor subunit [Betaproteobacteria bacterium]MCL2886991.1 MdtA/MuxA family multidrug efflux RND transporter periplasmic adaptor subunit [Betaproteobacteria bacterium]